MTEQTKALVKAEADGLIPQTQNMVALAKHLLESKMFPNAGSLAGVVTIMEYGRELGLPPVAALNTMAVIRGRLTMEAKAMLAVANKNAGVSWKVVELTNDKCTMQFNRPGFEPCTVTFTVEEAKEAGLLSKDAWKLYRQDMLFARCASRGVRRIAPDAVLGLYSTEEMQDVKAIDETARKDMEGAAKPVPAPVAPEPEAEVVVDEAPADEFDEPSPPVEFPPDEEEPPHDSILESYIAEIRQAIERSGVDEHKFKEWLYKKGPEMKRKYVGKVGKVLRFHLGNPDDIKYLQKVIQKAIDLYSKEIK